MISYENYDRSTIRPTDRPTESSGYGEVRVENTIKSSYSNQLSISILERLHASTNQHKVKASWLMTGLVLILGAEVSGASVQYRKFSVQFCWKERENWVRELKSEMWNKRNNKPVPKKNAFSQVWKNDGRSALFTLFFFLCGGWSLRNVVGKYNFTTNFHTHDFREQILSIILEFRQLKFLIIRGIIFL